MALTAQQKFDIRLYMGWSERFHQFDSELEHALSALDTTPEATAAVLGFIDQCKRIDEAITAAEVRLKALEAGPIKLSGIGEIDALRGRGRQFVGRIASVLGVEVRHDVFSPSLPSDRATRSGMNGGGNRQMHG
jgi:hypothetical protein